MRRAIRILATTGGPRLTALPRIPPRRSFAAAALKPAVPAPPDLPPQLLPAQDASPPAQDAPLKLRSYQEECIQAVLQHVEAGHHRMGISLATGSGKTVIFTQLISRLDHPASELATQTLILAHRKELVQQAAAHCRRTYPDATIEIEMANTQATGAADITVASVQSLVSGDRLLKFDPLRYKLILVDECHHAVSPSYMDIFEHFGVLNMEVGEKEDKPILVGVSATMSRLDGLKLGKVLDYVVYHKDYVEMINEKWLSAVLFTTVQTHADLTQVKSSRGGDFNTEELSSVVNTPAMNDITVRAWAAKAGIKHRHPTLRCLLIFSPATRKSTLVFCVDIAHVVAMTETFRRNGVDARYVTSNTHAKERAELLRAFRAGEFPVFVNCGIFTEGTDIPNIDCVLLARPTQSRNLIVQMIGRGMRLHPDKTNCHVIDMVGSVSNGIVSVPTLLGLDPDELLDEASIEDVQKKKEENDILMSQPLPLRDVQDASLDPADVQVTFNDYDTVEDLLADSNLDQYVNRYTQLAWVCVGKSPQRYVLSCGANGSIIATGNPDKSFTVTEHRKVPKELIHYMKARPQKLIDRAPNLEAAVRGADTYALSKYPRYIMTRNMPWRKTLASPQQRKMLEKMLGKESAEKLTKGSAMDMLTRLKHGAKGWFEELKKEGNAKRRETKKTEAMQARVMGHVKVGKLEA